MGPREHREDADQRGLIARGTRDDTAVVEHRYRERLGDSRLTHRAPRVAARNQQPRGEDSRPGRDPADTDRLFVSNPRSEAQTSELPSLMRSSYAVCCLTDKQHNAQTLWQTSV